MGRFQSCYNTDIDDKIIPKTIQQHTGFAQDGIQPGDVEGEVKFIERSEEKNRMTDEVSLRDVIKEDLPVFFEHQNDPVANRMAAFPARERESFMAHWRRILSDETILKKTILYDGQVAGNIVSFKGLREREVGYWLGREYWGKGIATRALSEFLGLIKTRPLYAHVAKHNIASVRVLEKCGFRKWGETRVPDEEIEEFILKLD